MVGFTVVLTDDKGNLNTLPCEGALFSEKVKQYLLSGIPKINGWGVISPFGDRAFFHGDWLLRAAAAAVGIYGNDAAYHFNHVSV